MSHSPARAPRRRRLVAGLAALAAAAVVLSGCSGLTSSSDSGGTSSAGGLSEGDAGGAAGATAGVATGAPQAGRDGVSGFSGPGKADAPGTVGATGNLVAGVPPKLAKSATLDLRVKDLAAAAASVRTVTAAQQGFVVQESIGTGGQPVTEQSEPFDGHGTMSLSVPAASLDATLTQLGRIGTVLSRGTSSADVTSQYVDTESRVKTMKASVERVRSLMARAKDIGQVVTLEGELSRRQSDLESLESQLEQLKGQVERSTVQVSLSTPTRLSAAQNNGFLDGLAAGWDAFTSSARGLLTAVGAVLPFAAFLALVGVPVMMWLRRMRRNGGSPLAGPLTASPAPDAPAAP